MSDANAERQRFDLDSLGELDDGVVRHLVNKALEEALRDCLERSNLDKARKVTVQIELLPTRDERFGTLKGVEAAVNVALRVPARTSGVEYLPTFRRPDNGKVEVYLPTDRARGLFDAEEAN